MTVLVMKQHSFFDFFCMIKEHDKRIEQGLCCAGSIFLPEPVDC